MNNLKLFFDLLQNDNTLEVGMDKCHYLTILGSVISKKPDKILEVGIGTAFLTVGLQMGVQYNQKGSLTCIDNWSDWGGTEPAGIDDLRHAGVTVVAPVSEKEFLSSCPSNECDFVVSDGDHRNSWSWVNDYFRVTKPDGFIFFHDTNNRNMFPSLMRIEQRVIELGLPYYHFTTSSRPDEQCERGLLFVINKKDVDSCSKEIPEKTPNFSVNMP